MVQLPWVCMWKLHIQSCLSEETITLMVELDVHIQLRKKMIGWFGCVIIAFFGATKPYQKNDDV
jgi:hypothetical protein